jgi:sensor c-di-GMP phosphodiesterase-like protein
MYQRRYLVILFTFILSLLIIFIPLIAAYYLSWVRANQIEEARLAEITSRLVKRVAFVYQEAENILFQLNNQNVVSPCSLNHIKMMQKLTFNSYVVDQVDYVKDGFLQCGTWGKQLPPIRLASTTEFTGKDGIKISLDTRSQVYPLKRMISLRFGNYHILINPARVSDIILDPKIKVALLTENGELIAATKDINLNLIKNYLFNKNKSKLQLNYLIASEIPTENLIAIAIEPKSRFYKTLSREQLLSIPLAFLLTIPLVSILIFYSKQRLSLTNQLKYAINNNELKVYYQPIIELKSGNCLGAEALIRWSPSKRESISPELFIPLAEKAGFTAKITKYIFNAVFREMSSTLIANKNMHISINVSNQDLLDRKLFLFLEKKLQETGIRHDQIWLEITERELLDLSMIHLIKKLNARGLKFAIDDFGSGYSNLSYLNNEIFQVIKIDKLFVDAIDTNSVTSNITNHIITIAKEADLKIVAEGVETSTQHDYLVENGVEYGQGYLYSPALSGNDFLTYLFRSSGEIREGQFP